MLKKTIAVAALAVTVGGTAVATHNNTSGNRAHLVVMPVPGAVNPNVTQANIGSTICASGWTATIRPPASTTDAIKRKLYADQHLTGGLGAYELDHGVSLEDGGAPNDLKNFWMQPIAQARKDDAGIEGSLRKDVCSKRKTLAQVQREEIDYKHQHG